MNPARKKLMTRMFGLIVAPMFLFGVGNRLVRSIKVPPELKIERAETLIQQKDYDAALDKLKEAREKLPQDPKISLLEGDVYSQQGKFAEAEQAYQEAEKRSPSLELYQHQANLFTRSKQYPKAEEALKKVQKLRPDYAADFDLALISIKMKDFDKARSYFESSKKKNPMFPDLYRNLGALAQMDGDVLAAKENFERYLQLNPTARDREKIQRWMDENAAAFESRSSNAQSSDTENQAQSDANSATSANKPE